MGLTESTNKSEFWIKFNRGFVVVCDFLKKVFEIESKVKTNVLELLKDEQVKNDHLIIWLWKLHNEKDVKSSDIIKTLETQSIFNVADSLKYFKKCLKDCFSYKVIFEAENWEPICYIKWTEIQPKQIDLTKKIDK